MSEAINVVDRLRDIWKKLNACSLVQPKGEATESNISEFQEILNLSIPITKTEMLVSETIKSLYNNNKGAFKNYLSVSGQEYFCLLVDGGIVSYMLGISHLVIIQTSDNGRYQVSPNDLYQEKHERKKEIQPTKILKRTEKEEPAPKSTGEPKKRRSRRGGSGRKKKQEGEKKDDDIKDILGKVRAMKLDESPRKEETKKTTWAEVIRQPPPSPKKEEKPPKKKLNMPAKWADVSDSE